MEEKKKRVCWDGINPFIIILLHAPRTYTRTPSTAPSPVFSLIRRAFLRGGCLQGQPHAIAFHLGLIITGGWTHGKLHYAPLPEGDRGGAATDAQRHWPSAPSH